MCCRRRRNRRAPLVVALGAYAYNKYTAHQEQQRATRALNNPTFETRISRSPSPEKLQHDANAEVLEKAGIPPPAYNDVVVIVNRAEVPAEEKMGGMGAGFAGYEDHDGPAELSDAESFFEVVNGRRVLNRGLSEAQASFIEKRKEGARENVPFAGEQQRRGCGRGMTCEEKKAAKAARKAEKAAAKAEKERAKLVARELVRA